MQPVYIAIALIVLAIAAILAVYAWKRGGVKTISRLAGLSFVFIMGGLIFGDSRLIGYSFLGLGVVFAIIDIVQKLRNKKPK